MSFIDPIINNLPEVAGPEQKRLSFKEKLKWTGIVLTIFFILGIIPLFGLGDNALSQFEMLSLILGAEFGSIISLGIGPIVTASIVLQLLNGSGIIKFDLTTTQGKKRFQGIQKVLAIFFIIFEAIIYVMMGGLKAAVAYDPSANAFLDTIAPGATALSQGNIFTLTVLLIFQLFLGGIMIMLMDEVISKWGFGSGISLFIAGGVSKSIMIRLISPFTTNETLGWPIGTEAPIGKLLEMFYSLSVGNPTGFLLALAAILATVLVFVIAVYGQSMKVEIPLSFGRIRGHGIRWPLSFIYTSNIPVILIAALMANIQLWARLLESWGKPLLGTFSGGVPASGLVAWINPPNLLDALLKGVITFNPNTWMPLLQASVYMLIMIGGAVMFSIFWVQTAGMDAKSQAKQIMASGLQIPGFRKDERVLERLLQRYIWPLTVMGAIAVGFMASLADLTGALSRGTGILLTVMIVYKLYEEIAKQHMMDMHPMMRKFME